MTKTEGGHGPHVGGVAAEIESDDGHATAMPEKRNPEGLDTLLNCPY